jgi:translation initiation factor eIF-2B subunit epsilon
VRRLVIVTTSHAAQIRNYVSQSQWSHLCVMVDAPRAESAGDALREVEARNLIRADFVLVSGDVIANMSLDAVLREHAERRAANRSCVMTVVFKIAHPEHRTRSLEDDLTVVLDEATQQLLHFDNDPCEILP